MSNGILNRNTMVPVGASVAAVTVIVVIVLWISARLGTMDAQLAKIEARAQNSEGLIRELRNDAAALIRADDRWTDKDMRNWVKLLQAMNPELTVPGAETD